VTLRNEGGEDLAVSALTVAPPFELPDAW